MHSDMHTQVNTPGLKTQCIHDFASKSNDRRSFKSNAHIDEFDFRRLGVLAKQLQVDV